MSSLPRTPVHFPRMKVRGRRNRAKSAARHETRVMMRVRVTQAHAADGTIQATFHLDPNGTHAVMFTTGVRDGWGRRVG